MIKKVGRMLLTVLILASAVVLLAALPRVAARNPTDITLDVALIDAVMWFVAVQLLRRKILP